MSVTTDPLAGPPADPLAGVRLRPVHRPVPFVTLRVVAALMLREMTTTYGRKPGGYVWAILEPIAGIMLLTWIFSFGFRHPSLGTNFAMYYATGIMPFTLFLQMTSKVSQSLRYSKPLLAYPRVTVIDAMIARAVLNLVLQLLIAYLVIGGIRMFQETGTTLVLSRVLLGFAMAAALGIGIGAFNCVPMTAFPLYATAWNILTRPLVLLSGVIFMIESMPEPFRRYLTWNPLVHVTAEVRAGFYYGYHPDYVAPAYVFMIAITTLMAGVLLTWRFHRDALET